MKLVISTLTILAALMMQGCCYFKDCSGDSNEDTRPVTVEGGLGEQSPGQLEGLFYGVSGISYATSSGATGTVSEIGSYSYNEGDTIEFFVDDIYLGEVEATPYMSIYKLDNAEVVGQVLGALDTDNDFTNGFNVVASSPVTQAMSTGFRSLSTSTADSTIELAALSDADIETLRSRLLIPSVAETEAVIKTLILGELGDNFPIEAYIIANNVGFGDKSDNFNSPFNYDSRIYDYLPTGMQHVPSEGTTTSKFTSALKPAFPEVFVPSQDIYASDVEMWKSRVDLYKAYHGLDPLERAFTIKYADAAVAANENFDKNMRVVQKAIANVEIVTDFVSERLKDEDLDIVAVSQENSLFKGMGDFVLGKVLELAVDFVEDKYIDNYLNDTFKSDFKNWISQKINLPIGSESAQDAFDTMIYTLTECTVREYLSEQNEILNSGKDLKQSLKEVFKKCGSASPVDFAVNFAENKIYGIEGADRLGSLGITTLPELAADFKDLYQTCQPQTKAFQDKLWKTQYGSFEFSEIVRECASGIWDTGTEIGKLTVSQAALIISSIRAINQIKASELDYFVAVGLIEKQRISAVIQSVYPDLDHFDFSSYYFNGGRFGYLDGQYDYYIDLIITRFMQLNFPDKYDPQSTYFDNGRVGCDFRQIFIPTKEGLPWKKYMKVGEGSYLPVCGYMDHKSYIDRDARRAAILGIFKGYLTKSILTEEDKSKIIKKLELYSGRDYKTEYIEAYSGANQLIIDFTNKAKSGLLNKNIFEFSEDNVGYNNIVGLSQESKTKIFSPVKVEATSVTRNNTGGLNINLYIEGGLRHGTIKFTGLTVVSNESDAISIVNEALSAEHGSNYNYSLSFNSDVIREISDGQLFVLNYDVILTDDTKTSKSLPFKVSEVTETVEPQSYNLSLNSRYTDDGVLVVHAQLTPSVVSAFEDQVLEYRWHLNSERQESNGSTLSMSEGAYTEGDEVYLEVVQVISSTELVLASGEITVKSKPAGITPTVQAIDVQLSDISAEVGDELTLAPTVQANGEFFLRFSTDDACLSVQNSDVDKMAQVKVGEDCSGKDIKVTVTLVTNGTSVDDTAWVRVKQQPSYAIGFIRRYDLPADGFNISLGSTVEKSWGYINNGTERLPYVRMVADQTSSLSEKSQYDLGAWNVGDIKWPKVLLENYDTQATEFFGSYYFEYSLDGVNYEPLVFSGSGNRATATYLATVQNNSISSLDHPTELQSTNLFDLYVNTVTPLVDISSLIIQIDGVQYSPVKTSDGVFKITAAFAAGDHAGTVILTNENGIEVDRRNFAFTVTERVIPNEISESPELLSPGYGTTVRLDGLRLQWSGVPDATYYKLAMASVNKDVIFNNVKIYGSSVEVNGLQSGESYVWTVAACNSLGCGDAAEASRFSVAEDIPVEPTLGAITSVTPLVAVVNQRQTFEIEGQNLPSSAAFSVEDCDGGNVTWNNASSVTYSCVPRATGSKKLIGAMVSGGERLTGSGSFTIQVSPEITAEAAITSVTPLVAVMNQRQTFEIGGQNLPSSAAFSVEGCDGGTVTWNNASSVTYSCVPRASGSKKLIGAMVSGGERLTGSGSFTIQVSPEVIASAPVINSFTLVENGSGLGKLRADLSISSEAALTTVRIHCSRSSSVSDSSSYDYQKMNSSSLGSGSHSVYLQDAGWVGSTVYCKPEVVDANDQKASFSIESIDLSSPTPVSTVPVINSLVLSESSSGIGKLRASLNISADASMSTVRLHCSRSSSVSTSSSYDYRYADSSSLSSGTHTIYLQDSDWAGSRVYCKAEVINVNGQKASFTIESIDLSSPTPVSTVPVINSLGLSESSSGIGKLRASLNISADASLSTVRLHCSRSSSVSTSSAYDYRYADSSSLSSGTHTIYLQDSDWAGSRVYCKAEVVNVNGQKASLTIESVNLSAPVSPPTYPDLTVSVSLDSSSYSVGDSIRITARVKNEGDASSNSGTITYYLSTNSNITSADTQIGTGTFSSLSAGATSTNTKISSFNKSTNGTTVYIGACVSSDPNEQMTSNNCSSGVGFVVN